MGRVRYVADWTDDNVEKLRKMAADGYSARDIAQEIPGATRSGVLGKARRIGIKLNGKHSNQVPNPDSRRQKELARAKSTPRGAPRSRKRKDPAPKPKIPDAPDMRRLTYAENDGCMWELEQRGIYCGAPNAKGYHFCPYHNHIARPPREKKPGHPGRE